MTKGIQFLTIRELETAGVITAIQDGNHGGSHPKASEYVPDGIPFVMASDIRDSQLRLETAKRLPKSRTDQLRIGFAQTGDVLLTHKGTVGEVAVVPDVPDYVMLTPQVTYYRVNEKLASRRYLAFTFRTPQFQSQLVNISAQSTRPYIAISTQRHLRVPWCELDQQNRIASILGGYDDLIEVNRRQMALLEEMARRLFEEWFVRFRFPGHEGHAMVDTPDGPLPEGWHTRRLGDVCVYLSRGIAPKYDETASTLVVGQKCIRDQHLSLTLARRQSRSAAPDKLVRPGDVLINSTGVGTLGRVAQAEEIPDGLTVDTHVTIVRPHTELDRDFFGLALLRMEPMFERMGAGATGQTELNRGRIADVILAIPPEKLQSDFGHHARPLRVLSYQLARQNSVLVASRDLLLPRLISGQLSVASAERELEAVA